MSRPERRRPWPFVAALVVAACGSSSGAGGDDVQVDGAWSRPTPAGTTVGAVYFRVEAGADDALTGVSVAADVADGAQLHMTMEGSGGTTMMHAVERLELPADAEVVLEPRGYHVMLLELVEPLAVGDTFEMTLEFAESPDLTVAVEVGDDPP